MHHFTILLILKSGRFDRRVEEATGGSFALSGVGKGSEDEEGAGNSVFLTFCFEDILHNIYFCVQSRALHRVCTFISCIFQFTGLVSKSLRSGNQIVQLLEPSRSIPSLIDSLTPIELVAYNLLFRTKVSETPF